MVSQNAGKSFEYAMEVPTMYDTADGATVVDKNSKTAPMGAGAVRKNGTEIDKPTVFDSADQSVSTEENRTKYDGGNAKVPPIHQKRVPTIKRVLTGEQVRIMPLPPVISSRYRHFMYRSLDFWASVWEMPPTLRILE